MTTLISIIIGISITYFMQVKTDDVPPRQRRQTPIINTGSNKYDFYIFLGAYVLLGLIIFVSGNNPLYFFENHDWTIGLFIPLNYVWWYMCFEGRKEMNESEERKKRLEEWKKNNPEDYLKYYGKE